MDCVTHTRPDVPFEGPVSFQGRIEAAFHRWGTFVVRRKWWVTFVSLAVAFYIGSWMVELTADFSDENFLLENDPSQQVFEAFREQYGRDDLILIGLQPGEVFQFEFLEKLRSLHEELEREVPYVDEITSLINARSTRGEGDELIVEELLENWPKSEAELAVVRARALGNKAYVGSLISKDQSFTAILVKLDTYSSVTVSNENDELEFADEDILVGDAEIEYLTNAEAGAAVKVIREILDRRESGGLEVLVVGDAISGQYMEAISTADSGIFAGLAIALVVVLLLLMFRRASAAALPLLVVILSMVVTLGIMARIGLPWGITSQVIGMLVIAVGICDSVHILAIVYQRLAMGNSREDAIAYAIGHSGFPVVMTSLTTAGGLVSFRAAQIAAVSDLGIISPIAVLIVLIYTLTLLPALLAIFPMNTREVNGPAVQRETTPIGSIRIVDATLSRIADLTIRHPVRVLWCTGLILLLAVPGVMNIRFSNDMRMWLFEDDPHRLAIEKFDRAFEGINSLEILIDTGRPNGLYEPENLRRIDEAIAFAEQFSTDRVKVGGTISLIDIVKETHRALNENRSEMYALPTNRELIAQELLLFENSGSEDLEKITDSQFQTARLTIRLNGSDGLDYDPFVHELEDEFARILGDDLNFQVTGSVALNSRAFTLLLSSMARSYVVALTVITPLMVLLIGRLRRGLLAMIPNLIPVYLTLALMGFVDIPLNISTLLVGSIIIGVAVDDTIHFMHQFGRYMERTGDPSAAIRGTFATTGTALLVTSIVLCGSFGCSVLGNFTGMVHFGILTFFATIVAFVSDVFVAPALMMVTEDPTSGSQR